MALDVLILGPFVFDDFAVPERLPFGGKQQTVVHKMPGGRRAIDCMGPDEDDRSWSGVLWGEGAVGQALTLDALRRSGVPLPYANGIEAHTVVISDFKARVRKFQCIEYDITVIVDDGGDGIGGITSIASLVASDLSSAVGLL